MCAHIFSQHCKPLLFKRKSLFLFTETLSQLLLQTSFKSDIFKLYSGGMELDELCLIQEWKHQTESNGLEGVEHLLLKGLRSCICPVFLDSRCMCGFTPKQNSPN